MLYSERSIRAQKLGLEALGAGKQQLMPGTWPRQRRVLTAYAVVLAAEGSLVFESARSGQSVIGSGSAFFLFPGVPHSYGSADERSMHYWFLFEGILADRWRSDGTLDPSRPVIDSLKTGELVRRWEECIVRGELTGSADTVTANMMGILGSMLLCGSSRAGAQEHGSVAKTVFAMRATVAEASFDLRTFCEASSLSYEYVRKLFRRTTGMSPHAYFMMLKLDAARKFLINGSDTITAVAHMLGFNDQYYFSRWFKKKERISPAQYRESFREYNP